MRRNENHFIPAERLRGTKHEICGITCCSIDDDEDTQKYAGIYILYRKKTRMPYVGRATSFAQRRAAHFSKSRKSSNKKLQGDIKRYGKKAFVIRCIETHHQGTMSAAEFEYFIWQREIKWYERILAENGGDKSMIYNYGKPRRRTSSGKSHTPVRQWLSATEFVDYPSGNFAAKKTGVSQSNISECIHHKSRIAGGYPWEEIPEMDSDCEYDETSHPFSAIRTRGYYRPADAEIPAHLRSIKRSASPRTANSPHKLLAWGSALVRPVRQWISEDPKVFYDYKSAAFAAKMTGIAASDISKCIALKSYHAGGHWWVPIKAMNPKHEFKEGITDPALVRAQPFPCQEKQPTCTKDVPQDSQNSLLGRSPAAQTNKPQRIL